MSSGERSGLSLVDKAAKDPLANTGENLVQWQLLLMKNLNGSGYSGIGDLIHRKVLPRTHPQSPHCYHIPRCAGASKDKIVYDSEDSAPKIVVSSAYQGEYRGLAKTLTPAKAAEPKPAAEKKSRSSGAAAAESSAGLVDTEADKDKKEEVVTAVAPVYGWYKGDPLAEIRHPYHVDDMLRVFDEDIKWNQQMAICATAMDAALDSALRTRVEQYELYVQARTCHRPDIMYHIVVDAVSTSSAGATQPHEATVSIILDIRDLLSKEYKAGTNLLTHITNFKAKVTKLHQQGFDSERTSANDCIFGVAMIMSVKSAFETEYDTAVRIKPFTSPDCTLLQAEATVKTWYNSQLTKESEELRMGGASSGGSRVQIKKSVAESSKKKGQGSGKGASSASGSKGSSSSSAGKDGSRKCIVCGSTGHWAANCHADGTTPAMRQAFREQYNLSLKK